ncbi:MAG: hypothetical protein JNK86_06640 [Alphaproteobacteria bacterium]|nr:hypothetical protein [Alphaproteobacteria bacterium]
MVIPKRTGVFNVWRFFCFLSLFILLTEVSLQHVQGQSINPLQSSTAPFIEPPMPDGFEGRPTFCNFVQSPNYQHTIWQCVLPETNPNLAFDTVSWRIAIDQQGQLTSSALSAPSRTYSATLKDFIREILAINNDNEWLARPLAQLPSAFIDYSKLYIIKPDASGSQPYDMQEISGFPLSQVLQAWNITGKGWLIKHRRNTRNIPPARFTLLDQTGRSINGHHLVELYRERGLIISKNGDIIHWGMADDQRDKITIICQSPTLNVIAKTTLDYPPEQNLIGLALPNNEVLLLKAEVQENQQVLAGYFINPAGNCQARPFETISLPSHGDLHVTQGSQDASRGKDQYLSIRWLKHAIILPNGNVILFYTEQLDTRYLKIEVSPEREDRARLWALQFNPLSQHIIWDKIVISSRDPASEAFTTKLDNNTPSISASYDPGLSLALLPDINQIWITLMIPERPPNPNFPHQPRIYQLPLD